MNHSLPDNIPMHPLVLLDFYADWCEPCKILDGILAEVKEKTQGMIHIHKINIEAEPPLAEMFDIKSVPVLILFKNGKSVWRMNGFMPAADLLNAWGRFNF